MPTLRLPDPKTQWVALSFLRSIARGSREPEPEHFIKAAKRSGVPRKLLEFLYAAEVAGVTLKNRTPEEEDSGDEPDPDIDLPQIQLPVQSSAFTETGDGPAVSGASDGPVHTIDIEVLEALSDALDAAGDEDEDSEEEMPWERRPYPSEDLHEPASLNPHDEDYDAPIRVAPDHDLAQWVRETFIEPGGACWNENHWHLADAKIGFLWNNVVNFRQGRQVMGTAELVGTLGDKWQTARDHFQLLKWFGEVPDFIITLDAPTWVTLDDASACALIEHELCHCYIKLDKDGNPKETPDGDLIFSIRGHDIEQFIDVVERYGARAAGVEAMVKAARRGPTISAAQIDIACGCCRR